ncbi:hypothetical protein ROSA5918_10205 [Roseateles saccharophilus]|uniref:PASTA domain-containing protein n=2 Tax=Roseateles saccharophilus TaxID=304 RepID=A0A4R3UQY2_ROSSA|nr:hypothetical protein [Roseateles saccharophilus]MDG0833625.1 hypothetical protein [Roseateles saccharophilus]TCU93211.1 hypothetical protein EV671_10199 [Roseateles saccharophilus]
MRRFGVPAAMSLLVAMSASMQVQAMDSDEPATVAAPNPPTGPGTVARLDLRIPPTAAALAAFARAGSIGSQPPERVRSIRLEPRKSLIERGVEGSREALIACQQGAYPGATVSVSTVKVAGGEAQPDHCYRF